MLAAVLWHPRGLLFGIFGSIKQVSASQVSLLNWLLLGSGEIVGEWEVGCSSGREGGQTNLAVGAGAATRRCHGAI